MGELSLRSVQFCLHIASEIRPRSDHILEVGCLVRLRLLQHALVCEQNIEFKNFICVVQPHTGMCE